MVNIIFHLLILGSIAQLGLSTRYRMVKTLKPAICKEYRYVPVEEPTVLAYLYNKDYDDFLLTDPILEELKLDTCEPVRFLTHGYQQTRYDLMPLVRAFPIKNTTSAIVLDWTEFVSRYRYMDILGLLKQIGYEFSDIIRKVEFAANQTPDKFHLMGFGLGAHIMGHAGRDRKHFIPFGLIVGLDPTVVGFDEEDEFDRNLRMLSRKCATHVRVIHTGGAHYGARRPMGHTDFYINGGMYQPGCVDDDENCSHLRVMDYMIENLLQKGCYRGDRCASWYDIIHNHECRIVPRPFLMYDNLEDPSRYKSTINGVYYFATNPISPYKINPTRLLYVASNVIHVSHTNKPYGSDYPLPVHCGKYIKMMKKIYRKNRKPIPCAL